MNILPLFQGYRYAGFEASMACDVVYGAHFEHRLLAGGRATMEHRRIAVGDVVVESGSYDFPVIARGVMPRESLCLGLMAEGMETTRLNTGSTGVDEIQIYPSGVDLLYHAARASRWVNFALPEDRLQEAATVYAGRPLKLSRRDITWVRLPGGRRAQLVQLTQDAFAIAKAYERSGMPPALASSISQGLINGYAAALCEATVDFWQQSAKARQHFHLLLACERIASTGDVEEIDLNAIARRSGYTRRSLELIFNQLVGMPPGRWFMNIRLNGALRDLLASQEIRISDIAAKWGFRHVPRFSAYFRRAFGELPSDTFSRARR